MKRLRITDACTACGACIVTCPERALAPAPKKPVLAAVRCTLCLACVEVCPRDAVKARAQFSSSRGPSGPSSGKVVAA